MQELRWKRCGSCRARILRPLDDPALAGSLPAGGYREAEPLMRTRTLSSSLRNQLVLGALLLLLLALWPLVGVLLVMVIGLAALARHRLRVRRRATR